MSRKSFLLYMRSFTSLLKRFDHAGGFYLSNDLKQADWLIFYKILSDYQSDRLLYLTIKLCSYYQNLCIKWAFFIFINIFAIKVL